MGLSDSTFLHDPNERDPFGTGAHARTDGAGIVRSERVVSRGEPGIGVAELKSELRIRHDLDDARLKRLLQACVETVENAYGVAVGEQRVVCGVEDMGRAFRLPRVPAAQIASIDGGDTPSRTAALDTGRFSIGSGGAQLLYDERGTRSISRPHAYHVVTYDAGFPLVGQTPPASMVEGILMFAVDVYESGGVDGAGEMEMPGGAKALLRQYRRLTV